MPEAQRGRHETYDDPPASTERSTPQTRRNRLRRALQSTSDLASERSYEMSSTERRRLGIIGPTSRRRQRSLSDDGEEARTESAAASESIRRRPKRRRLASPTSRQDRQPIKYGYYGQVEPGRLKLELVSCDGGEIRDRRTNASLGPENLLKHDKSVYSSERETCNIIFEHTDDTPFTLEKLHILAPDDGFGAPVRAGIVYVGMEMKEVAQHIPPPHAQRSNYSVLHRRARQTSIQASPERLSLADALRDREINAALDTQRQDDDQNADGTYDFTFPGSTSAYEYYDDYSGAPLNCDRPAAENTSDGLELDLHDNDQPRAVLLDDDPPGPEDATTEEVLAYRQQRTQAYRRRLELDNWDREDRLSGMSRPPPRTVVTESDRQRWNMSRLDALMARSRMHDSAEPDEDPFEDELGVLDEIFPEIYRERDVDKKVFSTRFKITRGRNKVAIKFDPPISGRFILLKVWSGQSNVDVQSVLAMGYGGCRFFPAVEPR